MKATIQLKVCMILVLASCGLVSVLMAQTPGAGTLAEESNQPLSEADKEPPVTLAMARDRAQLLHRVYASTLEVMHERYFHEERAIVPARAMEDVFTDIARQSQIKARWISVNTKAMSVHHEPKSEFEKQAAKEIAAGKPEFERVEQGIYHRAVGIPLASSCVTCHVGHFSSRPKTPRFAGLVISIPLSEKPNE